MAKKKKQVEDEFADAGEQEEGEDFPAPTPIVQQQVEPMETSEIEMMEQRLRELKAVELKRNLINDFPIWKDQIEKELMQINAYLERMHPIITLHNRKFKELDAKKK